MILFSSTNSHMERLQAVVAWVLFTMLLLSEFYLCFRSATFRYLFKPKVTSSIGENNKNVSTSAQQEDLTLSLTKVSWLRQWSGVVLFVFNTLPLMVVCISKHCICPNLCLDKNVFGVCVSALSHRHYFGCFLSSYWSVLASTWRLLSRRAPYLSGLFSLCASERASELARKRFGEAAAARCVTLCRSKKPIGSAVSVSTCYIHLDARLQAFVKKKESERLCVFRCL